MAKKRGLAANRGLDALLGSIKKEKQIAASALQDDTVVPRDVHQLATTKTASDTDLPLATSAVSTNATTKQTDSAHKKDNIESAATNTRTRAARAVSNKHNPRHTDINSSEDQISLIQIDVMHLQAGKYQPRRDMSETALAELASSIKQHGVMQPIVIRPLLAREDKSSAQVTHEIIAGERRWRAAKMAGKAVIPAIERALSDELAIALALIENIQREDLSVIEQAAALQRFHTEFGMSHAMIAEVVGKARTIVLNFLCLN